MARLLVGAWIALAALASWGQPRTYVHSVVFVFEPGSAQVPRDALPVLGSMFEDARRGCESERTIAVTLQEVAALPLGRTAGAATARTRAVASAARELSPSVAPPFEASVSPGSERARRMRAAIDQVIVELTCPAREQ